MPVKQRSNSSISQVGDVDRFFGRFINIVADLCTLVPQTYD